MFFSAASFIFSQPPLTASPPRVDVKKMIVVYLWQPARRKWNWPEPRRCRVPSRSPSRDHPRTQGGSPSASAGRRRGPLGRSSPERCSWHQFSENLQQRNKIRIRKSHLTFTNALETGQMFYLITNTWLTCLKFIKFVSEHVCVWTTTKVRFTSWPDVTSSGYSTPQLNLR